MAHFLSLPGDLQISYIPFSKRANHQEYSYFFNINDERKDDTDEEKRFTGPNLINKIGSNSINFYILFTYTANDFSHPLLLNFSNRFEVGYSHMMEAIDGEYETNHSNGSKKTIIINAE